MTPDEQRLLMHVVRIVSTIVANEKLFGGDTVQELEELYSMILAVDIMSLDVIQPTDLHG